MVNKKEIQENWKKVENQLGEAKRFLDENKADEALYFTWLAAENAEFHPYTSIPKDYTHNDVLNFMKEIKEFKKEVENILINEGVLQ